MQMFFVVVLAILTVIGTLLADLAYGTDLSAAW